jgi:hypothetical protein
MRSECGLLNMALQYNFTFIRENSVSGYRCLITDDDVGFKVNRKLTLEDSYCLLCG